MSAPAAAMARGETAGAASAWSMFRRLLGYARPYWVTGALATAAAAAVAVLVLARPWLFKLLVDDVFGQGNAALLAPVLIAMVALEAVLAGLGYAAEYGYAPRGRTRHELLADGHPAPRAPPALDQPAPASDRRGCGALHLRRHRHWRGLPAPVLGIHHLEPSCAGGGVHHLRGGLALRPPRGGIDPVLCLLAGAHARQGAGRQPTRAGRHSQSVGAAHRVRRRRP